MNKYSIYIKKIKFKKYLKYILFISLPAIIWFALVLYFGRTPSVFSLLYKPSKVNFNQEYSTFDEYKEIMRKELYANRVFFTSNKTKEVEANAPQEIKPELNTQNYNAQTKKYTKAVLLIHGLGDSPYSFVDISKSLARQGYLVRTILLHGHGTKPGDMVETSYEDWEKLVHKQTTLIKEAAQNVYLGGFSTGANLAFFEAVKDKEIKGLMLFSPAFKSSEQMLALTPILKNLIPWAIIPEKTQFTNFTKYTATPSNGYAQYYHTSNKFIELIEQEKFSRPVFAALSESDSILDVEFISKTLAERFDHPNNKLMWFGKRPPEQSSHKKLIHKRGEYPEHRITNISHMGLLYNPTNPYYGLNATEIICNNNDKKHNAYEICLRRAEGNKEIEIWFGADGTQSKSYTHARNTYNPEYLEMIKELLSVFNN